MFVGIVCPYSTHIFNSHVWFTFASHPHTRTPTLPSAGPSIPPIASAHSVSRLVSPHPSLVHSSGKRAFHNSETNVRLNAAHSLYCAWLADNRPPEQMPTNACTMLSIYVHTHTSIVPYGSNKRHTFRMMMAV